VFGPIHLNGLAAICVSSTPRRTPWNLHIPTINLVRVVAENWNLRSRLSLRQSAHPYTFFGAKTAGTFSQFRSLRRRDNGFRIRCRFAGDGLLAPNT